MMSFTTLDKTNFPLYAVNVLQHDHFLIAGGGGAAKTGVPNALNIYKVGKDGGKLKATLAHSFEAGRRAIMNCAVHPTKGNILAVGMDNRCQILDLGVKDVVQSSAEGNKSKGKVVRQNKRTFNVTECKSQVTVSGYDGKDDDDDVGFQKVVRFTADGNFIVTGGSDGHVRILKYPSLDCLHDIQAHTSDVDDLVLHPNGKQFVTVSRDTKAYVWRIEGGKKEFQLYFSAEREEGFFRVRACRFGVSERKDVSLYTINVPSRFNRKVPTPCYLVKWDCQKWIPKLSQDAGMEPLTQLAVSANGVYVGVGTSEGAVGVYISWNLMPLIKVPAVHNIFVTGLEFLPDSRLVNEELHNEFALLSISADNTCRVTTLQAKREFSIWWVLAGFLVLLYLTFMGLAYLGFDM